MYLEQLARLMTAYLDPRFTSADRTGLRRYALFELERHGIRGDFALLDFVDVARVVAEHATANSVAA